MNDLVREAARALLSKLDAAHPFIESMCVFMHCHGEPYNGPTFGKEREALRDALAAPVVQVSNEPSGAERAETGTMDDLGDMLDLVAKLGQCSTGRDMLALVASYRKSVRAALLAAAPVSDEQLWALWREHMANRSGPLTLLHKVIALARASQPAEAGVTDADRYRWLRDYHIGDDPLSINLKPAKKPGLDAAVDAAISAHASWGASTKGEQP